LGQMFCPIFSFTSKRYQIVAGGGLHPHSHPAPSPAGFPPTRTAPPPPPPAPTRTAGSHLPPLSPARAAPYLSRMRRRRWAARPPPLFTPSTTPPSPSRRLLKAQNATGWLPCLSRIHPIKLVAGWPSPRSAVIFQEDGG
jgi:hypothetical protein